MKRFTRIMLLLSAVFIASGCLFCFIGTALGGQVSDVFDNVYLDTGKGRLVVSGQGISQTDFTRRCAGVKSLEIDVGLADCTVIRSAVSEVRITGNSSGNGPEMFQEDGTLYITQYVHSSFRGWDKCREHPDRDTGGSGIGKVMDS